MELLSATAVRPDRAVIIVTHDSRIFDFADQIAHMDDGRITSLEQNRKNGSPANGLAPNSGALPLAEVELRASPATGD
jgi:ABC-type siderophore export system fused ATPase/permease subunit